MGLPIIESQTTATTEGTADSTLSFSEPAGLAADDLIFIIAVNENQDAYDWDDITTPDAFTHISHADNGSDVQMAIYYRVATGSETWPLVIDAQGGDFAVGWCLRISDVNTSGPINQQGVHAGVPGSASSGTIAQVTTDAANCLVVAAMGRDGSDAAVNPTTFSGTGWTVTNELEDPTGDASGIYACWGEKGLVSAGGSVDCGWSSSSTDGFVGIQIAIEGGAGGGGGADVNATLATVSLNALDATITALVDSNISASLATISLSTLNSTVTALVNNEISATTASITLNSLDATISTLVNTDISASLATVSLNSLDATVEALVNTEVTASTASINVSALDAIITTNNNTSVNATTAAISISALDAVIQGVADYQITATTASISLLGLQAVISSGEPVELETIGFSVTITDNIGTTATISNNQGISGKITNNFGVSTTIN